MEEKKTTANESKLSGFFKGVKSEFQKIVWPTKELLAKQTVQGTNYVFLAQGTTVTAKPVKAWYVLTATKNLKKKIKLLSIKKIKLSGIKTGSNPRTDTLDGGLDITAIKNKNANMAMEIYLAISTFMPL